MRKLVFFVAVAMIIIVTAACGWAEVFHVAAPFTQDNPWVVHGLFLGIIGMGISVAAFAIAEYRQWQKFMDEIHKKG